MTWLWEIVERDHEIQNPTTPEKIRLLGDYLRLGRESHVLDMACGQGGPAIVLASAYGCRILGVESRAEFAGRARTRIAACGLDSLIEVRTGDAAQFALEDGAWDAALCLGASFVWGNIRDATDVLVPAVRAGGFVAVGEPFWRRWPLPEGVDDEGYVGLDATLARFTEAGVAVTGLIAASEDDWDHYESLHWRAVEEWLADELEAPVGHDVRLRHERYRGDFFRYKRALLGWGIFIGRRGLAPRAARP
ncbi:MAG: cyclopropane-fatty-acyl-phospholipid synthase family protein [Gaiellaceae bacterium]